MKRFVFVSTCLLLLISLSCNGPQKLHALTNYPDILPGWHLLPNPNSNDKPGVVFGVDAKGVRQPMDILEVPITQSTVEVGKDSGKISTTMGALLGFLGTNKINLTADVNTSVNKQVTYAMHLTDPQEDQTQLLQISDALQRTKQSIANFITQNGIAGYKFYIITDAIKSTKLDYTFDGDRNGNVEVKADIDKVLTVNPNVKWTNSNAYQLAYDLKTPLYVFAKYFELNVVTQATGETKLVLGNQVMGSGTPIYK